MSTEFKSKKSLEKLAEVLRNNKSIQSETHEKLDSNVLFEVNNKKDKKIMRWLLDSKTSDVILVEINDNEKLKPDITIKIDDLNLKKLINGKQSAQKLFMMGKLKIKGNVMKASYIEKLLKYAGGKERAKL